MRYFEVITVGNEQYHSLHGTRTQNTIT